jgi:hypothetical protein
LKEIQTSPFTIFHVSRVYSPEIGISLSVAASSEFGCNPAFRELHLREGVLWLSILDSATWDMDTTSMAPTLRTKRLFTCVLAVAVVLSPVSLAQGNELVVQQHIRTNHLSAVVVDPTGAAIPKAKISLFKCPNSPWCKC